MIVYPGGRKFSRPDGGITGKRGGEMPGFTIFGADSIRKPANWHQRSTFAC